MGNSNDEYEELEKLGLSVPHLGPQGEMAREEYDHNEMSEYLGYCLICGELLGFFGCLNCSGLGE